MKSLCFPHKITSCYSGYSGISPSCPQLLIDVSPLKFQMFKQRWEGCLPYKSRQRLDPAQPSSPPMR